MKKQNSKLASYMCHFPEEGVDLDRFVERGALLLGPEDLHALPAGIAALREKICLLRANHPKLVQQLEFLEKFIDSNPSHLPDNVCNETAFALLYAMSDMDLIPDNIPDDGYSDDAAVIEIVLSRNEEIFKSYCRLQGIDWADLRPGLLKRQQTSIPDLKLERPWN